MELDSAIFSRYLSDGIPTFRVYRWSAPSFTYGVSQKPEGLLHLDRCMAEGVGVAGRMTGGGLLFHDDEITYSFVCGKEDVGEPAQHLVAYRQICAFLIRFYRSIGLSASFALEAADFGSKSSPSRFCACSHEKYDILISGKKIGGNAQKRSRQAIFQHGSIPIKIDHGIMLRYIKGADRDSISGVTALSDELGSVPDRGHIEDEIIEAFSLAFNVNMIEEHEVAREAAMA